MTEEIVGKRQRHRPSSLNLQGSNLVVGDTVRDMSDCAMKCLSPGLPPLSSKMKTTVDIAKTIAVQQRQIIASRTSLSLGSKTEADHTEVQNGSATTDPETLENEANDENMEDNKDTASTSRIAEENMENLSIPTEKSNKRLRRNNAPPPLNMNLAYQSTRPTIKSAPIHNMNSAYGNAQVRRAHYSKRFPVATSTGVSQFPSNIVMTPNGPARLATIPPASSLDPQHAYKRQSVSYAYGAYALPSGVPKTARNSISYRTGVPLTQQQLAKYQQQLSYQQEQWINFKEYRDSKKVSHVTDIFEGDATRLAPVSSQPLSAQRAFFNMDTTQNVQPQQVNIGIKKVDSKITEDSHGEVEAAAARADNTEAVAEAEEEDSEEDGPETRAIEENAKSEPDIRNTPTRVEIRISDSIFKFELEETEPETDKERFLKHCAAAWENSAKLQ